MPVGALVANVTGVPDPAVADTWNVELVILELIT
jgi:hypothetical protein